MRRLALVVALAGCSRGDSPPPPPPPKRVPAPPGTLASSTIAARDYIGPAACGECHADQHAAWSASLHAVMNQRADAASVIGDFSRPFVYAGTTVTFGTAPFAMTFGGVTYPITRTIGRRGLQEYVGVSPDGVEVRLPIGWWPRLGAWVPQAFFDPWLGTDDSITAPSEPWAERCPWCHSTYPFAQRIARASRPRGSIPKKGHGLEQHFVAAPGSERLDVAAQVSVGISCESCHLGGRAHADGAPIHFVPLGATPRPGAPAPTTFAQERRDPAIVNAVCTQCHSGPSPRFPDGTATRNSSEGLDLAASPCTTATCTHCHDPHAGGADEARALAACVTCHDPSPAHAGAEHAGVTCLDCHMPRVVTGLDRMVRTHRISSPTDPRMLGAHAPNACNLCHLDRPLAWTIAELRARGNPLTVRDPDPGTPLGSAWLDHPPTRLIAAFAFARSPLGTYARDDLRRHLADPRPYVRTWIGFALADLAAAK